MAPYWDHSWNEKRIPMIFHLEYWFFWARPTKLLHARSRQVWEDVDYMSSLSFLSLFFFPHLGYTHFANFVLWLSQSIKHEHKKCAVPCLYLRPHADWKDTEEGGISLRNSKSSDYNLHLNLVRHPGAPECMLAQQSADYHRHTNNVPEGVKSREEVVDMLVEYSIWANLVCQEVRPCFFYLQQILQ